MAGNTKRKYTKANETAWDEVTPIHQSYRTGQVEFFRNGGNTIDRFELMNLPDLHGLRVAHLCCNCGQDTISLVTLGAVCVGFDQSGKAIEEARRLSAETGISAEFVKTDVLDIPWKYQGKFDLVYISIGVLVWMPDIYLLMKNASALLTEGGKLFLYDEHPFIHVFEGGGEVPLEIKYDYFDSRPSENRGLDYIGGSEYDARPNYQFMVRVSDVLNGIIDSGMKVTRFLEFDHSIEDARPGSSPTRSDGKRKYLMPHPDGIPKTMLVQAVKE